MPEKKVIDNAHEDPTLKDPKKVNDDDFKKEKDEIEKKPVSGSAFYKNKLEELERKNAEMLAQLEESKTRQLKEKENYKELYEIEKNKRLSAEEKAVKISKDYLTGLKMSAIESEALKAGMLPEALDDIRPEEATMVEIETGDKGTVSILGAKEYVEFLRETKKHWFKNNYAPKINNSHPSDPVAPKKLTARELLDLQKTDPKKYEEEIRKRLAAQ